MHRASKVVRPQGHGWLCRYTRLALGAVTCIGLLTSPAQAASRKNDENDGKAWKRASFTENLVDEFIKKSKFEGQVGVYDFRRWHDSNQPYPLKDGSHKDDHSKHRSATTAVGAQIGLKTGRLYGFSAGGEFVFTAPTQTKGGGRRNLNANLADETLLNNTQGYLQYNAYGMQIRGGRQLINTPLASPDQFSFEPRSFQGVSGVWRPLETINRFRFGREWLGYDANDSPQIDATRSGDPQSYETNPALPFDLDAEPSELPEWKIFAAKMTHFKARGSSEHFHSGNRYFDDTDGFWTVGTSFHHTTPIGQFIAQYYHYRFQQTESADYGEIGYMAPTMKTGDTTWAPYVRAQLQAAYDGDRERIPEGINAQIYGLKLGIDTDQFDFSIYGNYSPEHHGYFNNGQMLHPYTDLPGVLYTDTMNDGMDNIGPGWAVGAMLDYEPSEYFNLYGKYVQYHARNGHYHDFLYEGGYQVMDETSFEGQRVRNQKSEAIDIGITIDLGAIWKVMEGFTLQDELGFTKFHGSGHRGAPNFFNNRARIFYEF